MRKIISIISLIFVLSTLLPYYVSAVESKDIVCYPYESQEESKEILYKDIFMTLLEPYIQKEVKKYYGVPHSVDPWANHIISIDRPNGGRTLYFIIKIEIMPYTGPHNTVGIDHITLSMSGLGEVKVLKFEHIRD